MMCGDAKMDELIREVKEATQIIKELDERVSNIEEVLSKGVRLRRVVVSGSTPKEKFENFLVTPQTDPELKQWQDLCDAYTVYALLRHRRGLPVEGWLHQRFVEVVKTVTSAELPGYIPTTFSARVFELIRLQPAVHGLFEKVDMPSEIYKPAVAFSGIEVRGVDAGGSISLSDVSAPNVEFRAKKLVAAVAVADEVTEDSIVPIVPALQREFAYAFGDALDKVILRGDTTSSDNLLKLWDGLVKLAGNPPANPVFDAQAVRNALAGLDVVNPNEAVLIVNPTDYGTMLGWNEVHTVDKYGVAATILTGELAKIYGIPVVVSPHANRPVVVLRRAFAIGWRRGIKVETDRDVLSLRDIIVASLRADFKKLSGTNVVKLALRGA